MQISKKNWTAVSFGDVAIQRKDDIDRDSEEVNRYVAGEHMVTEDLHIRQWGVLNGQYLGPAFRRKFEKGDILYGSRRTYLKKVAVADFDGITANTTFVIKPNRDKIFPGLLPFLMLSDSFTEHSVKHSKGSVNPYINWKDIANFTFKLPLMDEQKRITDLLWGIDDVEDHWEEVKQINETAGKSLLRRALRVGLRNEKMVKKDIYSPFQTTIVTEDVPVGWNIFQIRDIVESVQTGFAEGSRDDNGIQQLRMQNVGRDCSLVWEDVIRVPAREGYEKYLLENRDVLFNNTNSEDLVGKSILFLNNGEPMVFSNHFTRIRVKTSLILPEYLYLWIRYHFEIGLFERRCTRWIGQAAVQTENLMSLYILLPPVTTQKDIVMRISAHDHLTDKIKDHIEKTNKIKKTLLNQIFG